MYALSIKENYMIDKALAESLGDAMDWVWEAWSCGSFGAGDPGVGGYH